MIESVHCPQCQTHYGLRPARVRYGLRRAKCFRCGDLFPIEDQVNRLLAAGLPMESPTAYVPVLMSPSLPKVEALEGVAEVAEMSGEDFGAEAVDTLRVPASQLAEAYSQVPEELSTSPAYTESSPDMPEVMPDSLTLQDLEGSDAEILDKTLVDFQAPPTPAPPLEPQEEIPASAAVTTAGGGSFSSAKDAIAKILGGMSGPPVPPAPHAGPTPSNPTDLEATLSALDETLGGNQPHPMPERAPEPALQSLGDSETLGGLDSFSLPEIELPPLSAPALPGTLEIPVQDMTPAASTVRLTREQMMAALQAPAEGLEPLPEPFLPPITLMPPDLEAPSPMESTLIMNVPAFTPPPTPAPVPPARTGATTSFMPVVDSADQNLFKVQLGTDTLTDLSMDHLSAMVREGRLADYHMVARQFSENWIEAGKVPALRPLFERQRREQQPAAAPEAPAGEAPKKSLFGGLFGRKEG